jgi:CoA:oxalate CoA-transferase
MDGLPLSGVRVLELAQLVAGPYCATLLGALGADVQKVEPVGGDFSRTFGPFVGGRSTFYESVNAGKPTERLDLGSEEGRERLEVLLAQSDVLVHNMTPRAAARLGLSGEELATRYPDLILCAISAFGEEGEEARRTGVDLLFQAESGLMSVTGTPGGPPLRVGTNVPDFYAAAMAALGVTAALYERRAEGTARAVHVSLLDATVALQACWFGMLGAGVTPQQLGNESPFTMPTGTFRAADGEILISIVSDRHWRLLGELLGLSPETVEAYGTNPVRCENRAEVRETVEAALSARGADEWVELLIEAGLPAGRVRTHREVHAQRPDLFRDVDGIPVARSPIRLSAVTTGAC